MDPKRLTLGVILALSLFLGATAVSSGASVRDPSTGGSGVKASEEPMERELSIEDAVGDDGGDPDGADLPLCTRYEFDDDDDGFLVIAPEFESIRKASKGLTPWDRDRVGNALRSDSTFGITGHLWKDQSGKRTVSPLDSILRREGIDAIEILVEDMWIVVLD